MKKHQIQAIAKIRKLLTDKLHTGWAMVDTVKACLDDTMSYEMENLMDDSRQMVQRLRIYDTATDDYREFTAPYIISSDDFRFSDIGLDETVFRSDPRLGYGINNQSRIGAKSAWIVDYNTVEHGRWFVLVSYDTVIGACRVGCGRIYLTPKARKYSTTTNRHISAFKGFIDTTIGARSFFEYAVV